MSFAPLFRRVRRLLPLLALAAPLAAPLAAQVPNLTALRQDVTQSGGRVIITLRSGAVGSMLLAAGEPPVAEGTMDRIEARLDRDYGVETHGRALFTGMLFADVTPARLAELAADSNVVAIEADRLWAPLDAKDVRVAGADEVPWGITKVGAPTVWGGGNAGSGAKVGVIDSGGDPNHPDIGFAGGYNGITRQPNNWADDIAICNGHGTHIAGTIAARSNGFGVVGVAPGVEIYAIKVFEIVNGQCLAYTSSQIAGLSWAVQQNIDVVNISIGGAFSAGYDAAISSAAAQGTYVAAAAGNTGGATLFPGSSTDGFSIAAIDEGNGRASWSAVGPEVDFSAPGVGINSTMPGGGYGGKSGTSMAAPHAAGVMALIIAANPGIGYAALRQKLRDGVLDLEGAGYDQTTGWGLLRADVSLGGGGGGGGPVVPVALAVSPASRNAQITQGGAAPSDNGTVTLTGTNAASTAWTAAKRKSWTTLTTGSGTGSGTVAWSRNATGLAAGTYVDTITVTAAGATGSPTQIIDTLRVNAAAVPVTMALSAAARTATAQQGQGVAGDNVAITFSGDNAQATAWTAAKRKSWTTITNATGTGNATLAWTRNTAGLGVGTYVDTITVTAPGATNSPRMVFDTLRITAAPVAVTLAVSAASRSTSAQQNTGAAGDNVTLSFTGDNAQATAWTAAKRQSWTALTNASGTGNATLAWTRNTAGLAVGVYVDTITISAPGASNAPRTVIDTLRITAVPVPVTLALSAASRSTSAQQNTGAAGDNVTLSFTGDNAQATAWTAAKRKSWTTITTATGTGNATLAWTRNTAGLAVGTYVDTITVTAPAATNAPLRIIDTLRITATPVPVTLTLSAGGRSVTAQPGQGVAGDNVTMTFTGDNAQATAWTATKRNSWTTITNPSGTGNATLAWTRNTAGFTPGVFVDTITITAPGAGNAPRMVFDTIRIVAAPVPVTVAVAPGARSASAVAGTPVTGDNATVTLSGDNAQTTGWTAAKRQAWTTLTTAAGTGNGTVAWTRNTAGLAVGTYVDTVTVTATGGATARVIDTLRITAAPVAVTLAVAPASRRVSVVAGGSATGDNATVTLSGTNAAATTWAASKRKSWTTVTSGNGTGGGTVTWTRNATGLAVGTYVDTITVTATGVASPAFVIDTLQVTAAPVPLTIALGATSRRTERQAGSGSAADAVSLTLGGTNAANTVWTASKRKSWTTLTVGTGSGSGQVQWSRSLDGLAAGTYVDTIAVTAVGYTGAAVRFVDTLVVTAPPTTTTVAIQPKGKKARVLTTTGRANAVEIALDSALVGGSVTEGQNDVWTASASSDRLTIQTPTGRLNQRVVWQRRAVGPTPALYVDTVAVTLVSDPSIRAVFVDTLEVVAVALPGPQVAVEELFRGGSLSGDQRVVLDRDGNNNGSYDLGDFLAWVDRAQIRLSPAILSRVQELMTAERARPGEIRKP